MSCESVSGSGSKARGGGFFFFFFVLVCVVLPLTFAPFFVVLGLKMISGFNASG